jgi:hypothetical protein
MSVDERLTRQLHQALRSLKSSRRRQKTDEKWKLESEAKRPFPWTTHKKGQWKGSLMTLFAVNATQEKGKIWLPPKRVNNNPKKGQ